MAVLVGASVAGTNTVVGAEKGIFGSWKVAEAGTLTSVNFRPQATNKSKKIKVALYRAETSSQRPGDAGVENIAAEIEVTITSGVETDQTVLSGLNISVKPSDAKPWLMLAILNVTGQEQLKVTTKAEVTGPSTSKSSNSATTISALTWSAVTSNEATYWRGEGTPSKTTYEGTLSASFGSTCTAAGKRITKGTTSHSFGAATTATGKKISTGTLTASVAVAYTATTKLTAKATLAISVGITYTGTAGLTRTGNYTASFGATYTGTPYEPPPDQARIRLRPRTATTITLTGRNATTIRLETRQ